MNTEYEEWRAELRGDRVHRSVHDWAVMGAQAVAVTAFVVAVIASLAFGGGWI
jgi:hypothetical protein